MAAGAGKRKRFDLDSDTDLGVISATESEILKTETPIATVAGFAATGGAGKAIVFDIETVGEHGAMPELPVSIFQHVASAAAIPEGAADSSKSQVETAREIEPQNKRFKPFQISYNSASGRWVLVTTGHEGIKVYQPFDAVSGDPADVKALFATAFGPEAVPAIVSAVIESGHGVDTADNAGLYG